MRYYIFAIIVCSHYFGNSQCPSGDLYLDTQLEVDEFLIDYPNCTTIDGDLKLQSSEITDLSPLINLTTINGYLWLDACTNLTSLNGLDNVTNTGSLLIDNLDALENLNGLNSLILCDDIFIIQNDILNNIDALTNIESVYLSSTNNLLVEDIGISQNPFLSSCDIYSVCGALNIPTTTFAIYDNLTNCNSKDEILDQCDCPDLPGIPLSMDTNDTIEIFLPCYMEYELVSSNANLLNFSEDNIIYEDLILSNSQNFYIATSSTAGTIDIQRENLITGDLDIVTVNINPALPITYSAKLTANGIGDKIKLQWSTAQEINNSHFIIQHSQDGGNRFKDIGKVEGNYNSNSPINYTYTHNSPLVGINYYRLKQVDHDGKFEYSDIVSVVFGIKEELSIHPNPATNDITITSNHAESYRLYNSVGKIMTKGELIEGSTEINIEEYDNGVYILVSGSGEVVRILKI